MRYPTIDALRGFALISMVSSHVSLPDNPTQADIILHKAVWIDGAFYFVALSGLVAGLVHRRIVDRYGFNASASKLTKRAGFIYLVQLGLVALTITLASVRGSAQLFNTPTWSELGGVLRGMVDVALLRVEPNFTGVLPMYVFFLLLAVPAVWALRRNLWWAVVGGSLLLFAVAKGLGGFRFASWGGSFDPFGWQLLFMGGLLLGWSWEHERLDIPERLRRYAVMASIAVTAVFLFLALRLAERTEDVFGPLLGKFGGPPLAFVFAGCALITVYAFLDWARRWPVVDTILRPVEILGVKGLPGYVAMVLTILFFATFPSLPRNDLTVIFVVLVAGCSEYGAWKLAQRRSTRTAIRRQEQIAAVSAASA
jgi:hypothetical protein